MVKPTLPLLYRDPEVQFERYCFQHIKTVLEPSGFYSHTKANDWVSFADFVPNYLQEATKAALREEMEKYVSDSDEDGYIYAYEIGDPDTPNQFHIKIGRSVNVVKRINDWSKQCGSREPVIRGWWAGNINENHSASPSSLQKGHIDSGERGLYYHRLERLIHLELADIALNSTYLTPQFKVSSEAPAQKTNLSTGSHKSSRKRKGAKPQNSIKKPCPDCEKIHKEIFTFQRVTPGEMEGRERECIVEPIIKKWGNFVTEYASKKIENETKCT